MFSYVAIYFDRNKNKSCKPRESHFYTTYVEGTWEQSFEAIVCELELTYENYSLNEINYKMYSRLIIV
jgi:hypothetical protein